MDPFDGQSADLYVRTDGDDEADGSTPSTAFATISRGVEALSAGETLLIGPGEYHESVRREGLGSADADTTIRAAIPGTVILRGDVDLGPFEPLEGRPFVFSTAFESEAEVQVVNELDTLTPLERTPHMWDLAILPGRFFHDREAGRLYISTSDRRPSDEHRYSASVIGTHGFYLRDATRVIVDGLSATGFTTATEIDRRELTNYAVWGMFLANCRQSVIRRAHVFMNGRGIGVHSSGEGARNNRIEQSVARGNSSRVGSLRGDLGGITLFEPQQDVVADSQAFLNGAYGINIRGGSDEGSLETHQSFLRRNLAWGNGQADFKIKTGSGNIHYVEYSASADHLTNTSNARHGLFGHSQRSLSADNIVLDEEEDLDLDAEFAAPDARDYRLQSTSRFRGTGPGGADRGPYPYEGDVYFVSSTGNDEDDGRSMAGAFRTVTRAAEILAPGDTLYLAPGVYEEEVRLTLEGSESAPIVIRGRGLEPAVVTGDWLVEGSRHLDLARLHFTGTVEVRDSADVTLENSTFHSSTLGIRARGATGLRVRHNLFTGFTEAGIVLEESDETYVTGNLFDNQSAVGLWTDGGPIRYADYNGYRHAAIAWRVGDGACALDEVRTSFERHSSEVSFDIDEERLGVPDPASVAALGPHARPLGPYRDRYRSPALELAREPSVHSVSATTANIEWDVSVPATTHFVWGSTPAMENEVRFEAPYTANYSFTELEPDTTYYFQVRSLSIPSSILLDLDPIEVDSPVLEFHTAPSDPGPVTYYVATGGDDSGVGTTRAEAFASIQRAADAVAPGDTVLIDEGVYTERVLIRATGTPEAPITFRNVPGARVELNGAGMHSQAFVIAAKDHLRFDGFFLDGYVTADLFPRDPDAGLDSWYGNESAEFNIYRSRGITIERCLSDGRGAHPVDVMAYRVDGLLLSNVVSIDKFLAMRFIRSPNLRVEHSVIVRPEIRAFLLRNEDHESSRFESNIFTDNLKKKAERNIGFMTSDRSLERHSQDNSLYLLREFPVSERTLLNDRFTLPEAEARGIITNYLTADPGFAALAGSASERFPGDRMTSSGISQYDFGMFMATHSATRSRGIGLQPERFTADGTPN